MPQYLLPCSCGLKTSVQPPQAGQTTTCACGASLSVPTMLEMTALEQLEEPSASRPATAQWGIREMIFFLGILILLVSLGPAIYLIMNRPKESLPRFTPELIQQTSQTLGPLQVWLIWRELRDRGPSRTGLPETQAYHEAVVRFRISMGVVLFIAAVGAGLIGVALRWKRWAPTGRSGPE